MRRLEGKVLIVAVHVQEAPVSNSPPPTSRATTSNTGPPPPPPPLWLFAIYFGRTSRISVADTLSESPFTNLDQSHTVQMAGSDRPTRTKSKSKKVDDVDPAMLEDEIYDPSEINAYVEKLVETMKELTTETLSPASEAVAGVVLLWMRRFMQGGKSKWCVPLHSDLFTAQFGFVGCLL